MSDSPRYLGLWEAEVWDNQDPDGEGKIRARIPLLSSPKRDFITKWAKPKWTSLRRTIPPVGHECWIEFAAPAITTDEPVWSGMYDLSPDDISTVPSTAKGQLDEDAPFDRGILEVEGPDLSSVGGEAAVSVNEPAYMSQAEYGQNHVWAGDKVLHEFDHTPGANRIHEAVGVAYRETREDGVQAERVTHRTTIIRGNDRSYTAGTKTGIWGRLLGLVVGDLGLVVGGTAYLIANALRASVGSVSINIDSDVRDDDGNVTESVVGMTLKVLGKMIVTATGDAELRGARAAVVGKEAAEVSGEKVQVTATDGDIGMSGEAYSVDVRNGKFVVTKYTSPYKSDALRLKPVLMSDAALTALLNHVHEGIGNKSLLLQAQGTANQIRLSDSMESS